MVDKFKKILLLAVGLFSGPLFAQVDFTISGKIDSLGAPAKAYISYRVGMLATLDSAEVKSGAFKFHGAVDNPTRALVFLMHQGEDPRAVENPDYLEVYLEKGNIQIVSRDSLYNASVKGGQLNADYSHFKSLMQQYDSEMNVLLQHFYNSPEELRADTDFLSEVESQAFRIQEEKLEKSFGFIKDFPSSQISLDLLMGLVETESLSTMKPLFQNLSSSLKASETGQILLSRIESLSAVEIGSIAPDFSQPDTAGTMISLSSLRGQYVLLDFWASWCVPCRQENPNIVAAYENYKSKNFTVFGVSLDRPGQKAAWLKAIQDDGLQDWPNVSDLLFWRSPVVEQYAIETIPQNFLLDPEGRIIARNLRGADLHRKLSEILD